MMVYLVGGPLDGVHGESTHAGARVLHFDLQGGGSTGVTHGRRPRKGTVAYHRAKGRQRGRLTYLHGTRMGRAALALGG